MNNSKRILALVLVLLMLLALTACGKKQPDLTGTWVTEIDMAPLITEQVDKELDLSGMGVSLNSFADYLDSMPCQLRMELKKDGTYLQSVDEGSLAAMQDKLFNSTLDFYRDLFRQVLIATLQSYGVVGDIGTDEELEASLGMTVEDAIALSIGSDMETYVHSVLDERWVGMADELKEEGKYKVEDGKLFLSDSPEHNVDPKVYHPFTLEKGVLTLEKAVGGTDSSELDTFFPLVFRAG